MILRAYYGLCFDGSTSNVLLKRLCSNRLPSHGVRCMHPSCSEPLASQRNDGVHMDLHCVHRQMQVRATVRNDGFY